MAESQTPQTQDAAGEYGLYNDTQGSKPVKQQVKRREGGSFDDDRNLKDGCLPKLFMLFLPFMIVGTIFFFKSIAR